MRAGSAQRDREGGFVHEYEGLAEEALDPRLQAFLLATLAFLASAQVLGFARSPECWSQLVLLRERSLWGALLPFPEYPYYRPLWFFWLSLADRIGWGGGAAHLAPLLLHCTGVLLVFAALRRVAVRRHAFAIALLMACAPGCASALSWLAAGNKCFVFFWLALGVFVLLRVASTRLAFTLALVLSAAPAIASAENGYMSCVMLPFVALFVRPRSFERARLRFFAASSLGVLAAALSALHLFVLSPQRTTKADNRVAELVAAWTAEPLDSALQFADNMGRFFLHGIGVADDAARVGAVLLAAVFVSLCVLRFWDALVGLGAFVILNVPSSVFPGESSRHHAYLPALGAGLLVALVLRRLPLRAYSVPLVALAFLVRGFDNQRPWGEYAEHSRRVYASCVEAVPNLPTAQPLLLNVPHEYRAAFLLHLGAAADVSAWPMATVLSSRMQIALPPGWQAPKEEGQAPPVLEYDGARVVATKLGAVTARQRAPAAWWEAEIRAFERPWLAWAENLRNPDRLIGEARSFEAAALTSDDPASVAQRRVEVEAHGLLEGRPGVFWECSIRAGTAAWLILPWTPWSALPTTENAWLFHLAPLPWAFEVEVFTRSDEGAWELREFPTHPSYGFLPSIWCDDAARRIRVELRLRGS